MMMMMMMMKVEINSGVNLYFLAQIALHQQLSE